MQQYTAVQMHKNMEKHSNVTPNVLDVSNSRASDFFTNPKIDNKLASLLYLNATTRMTMTIIPTTEIIELKDGMNQLILDSASTFWLDVVRPNNVFSYSS